VTFKTTPLGLNLAPGDFIRVVTQSSYVEPTASGIIRNDGVIVSPTSLQIGQTYSMYIWSALSSEVGEANITVRALPGEPATPWAETTRNAVFAVKETKVNSLVYMVDSINLDEDGLVQITASYFPVNSQGESLIADELKPTSGMFSVIADENPN
jgi:hypothetical protein